MPILAPLVPAGATAAGGTAAVGTTAAVGLTATEMAVLGGAALLIGGVVVVDLLDDYLDTPATESEVDAIQAQAGDRSKADERRLQDCESCIWCMVNMQAQGSFVDQRDRTAPQGIGPYLVEGRTVFVREGIMIAGLTHEFARGIASRRDFRDIERFAVLAKTIAFIQRQPPTGLAFNSRDNRPGSLNRYSGQIRYDINVFGTVNAFMS
ncbi:MAG: hypothetical protein ABJN34_03760 [Litoreibacter sp.]|uniref:hypothetical protein n=1 Tax=Litoreibacter sp. TaxID=1969459 RepID=UPI00329A4BCC